MTALSLAPKFGKDADVGAPMPIRLGAGASAGGGVAECAAGTFPPLTTNAGASGCSSSTGLSDFSATADLAGTGAAFADFVDAALGRECSTFDGDGCSLSADAVAFPSVMSDCETGAEVVAVIVGWTLAGLDDSEAETGADVAAG